MLETKDEMLAHELVAARRRGWKDGACSLAKRAEVINHPTRPDLTAAYEIGYSAGIKARIAADREICEFYGYVPNVLR